MKVVKEETMTLQQASGATPSTSVEAAEQQRGPVGVTGTATSDTSGDKPLAGKQSSRHLVIRVFEGGEVKANIRLPLGLARAAEKFIPRAERAHLKAQGIDVEEILGELTGDELGPVVQVDDDGKSVWIAVE